MVGGVVALSVLAAVGPHPVRQPESRASIPPKKGDRLDSHAGLWIGLALGVFLTLGVVATAYLLHSAAQDKTGLAPGSGFGVNLVRASNHGCSQDGIFSGADLSVKVRLDGNVVLASPVAVDRNDPLFGLLTTGALPQPPVKVEIEVTELDKGFGSTSTHVCDVSSGPGTSYQAVWNGGLLHIEALGDAEQSAYVEVVIGPGPPALPPQPTVALSGDSARVDWPTFMAPRLSLARGNYGLELAGTVTTSATMAGLCDGMRHSVRLITSEGDWKVAGPDREFTTPDLPPAAPHILSAQAGNVYNGFRSLQIAFDDASSHDTDRVEVFTGTVASFPRDQAHMRGRAYSSSASVNMVVGDEWVVLRTVDKGGHATDSEAVQVGTGPTNPSPLGSTADPCMKSDEMLPSRDARAAAPAPAAAIIILALAATAQMMARRRT